jgi:c-di-GMP phosphodiesterase
MKTNKIPFNNDLIPEDMKQNWQRIVDLLSKILRVPAVLIMRVHPPTIEVFNASSNIENPYKVGEIANLDGLYCNTVMEKRQMLLIPNALKDPIWKKNPDIELGMISYLGFPLI